MGSLLRAACVALAMVGAVQSAAAVDISVNFTNAQTTFGRVNTELHTLGSLYFQNRDSSTATFVLDVDSSDAKRAKSFAADSIESTLARGVSFTFGFTGLEVLSQAAIAAEAKRSARLYVKGVATETYASPLALVNSPALAAERAIYAGFCPPKSCRFVFVNHVTKVDEGGFGFGRAVTVGGKLTFPATSKIQGFEAKIGYDSNSALNFSGKSTPMFYRSMSLVLVPKGNDYVFMPDIPRPTRTARR